MNNKNKITILVVDDQDSIRNSISQLLEDEGYNAIPFSQGDEMLVYLEDHFAHLLLLDIMMPGKNGLELLKIIRAKYSQLELPVILVTALDENEDIVRGFSLGANDYISKPPDVSILLARIKSVLLLSSYHRIMADRNKEIESELEMAREILNRILPGKLPILNECKIDSLYLPMDKVGGDFYGFYKHEDSLDLIIADVSGHGIPAAFMATVASMSFNQTAPTGSSCKNIIQVLNKTVEQNSVQSNFVTALCAKFIFESKTLYFSSAGHCSPLLLRDGKDDVHWLKARGLPLGLASAFSAKSILEYEENNFVLEEGDRILFYTDGLTECADENNIEFGEERFAEFALENRLLSASEFRIKLLAMLTEFSKNQNLQDDMSLVIMDIQ